MKLYIAEKPSLGRAIADVLPRPHQRGEGFIRVGNGDCVSWCIGHLLEQAEPEVYDPAYKQWRVEHLPIVPEKWRLQPKASTKKQLAVLRQLVKEAEHIVHAGDPDREGQLLVDQVINYLGVAAKQRAKIQRCLISDLNPAAVQRALTQLQPNSAFIPLSTSALARSRADWLYGINMTRAYTLQGRRVGYQGVLSVGRVQTPVLGLVVRRDEEIERFVSKPFYEVLAHLRPAGDADDSSNAFSAKWRPSDACVPYMDEEGRVLSRALAETVVKRVSGQPGKVISVDQKKKTQAPPLPYSLSSLQIDAARAFGMSAQQVLDHCQNLYERHKLITYPRSDSRYLPDEHWQQASGVVTAIASNSAALKSPADQADLALKSKAWNDSKVEAHHAIIPTQRHLDLSKLAAPERQLYEMIATQYLCQFYPVHEYLDTRVEVLIAGGLFVAKARRVLQVGWKSLKTPTPAKQVLDEPEEKTNDGHTNSRLPPLCVGDPLHCHAGEVLEKHTQPPRHFTDATLLAAMTGIARFVKDAQIRKVLKETDGLGTEATRAGILELLFTRGFLQRQGKQIRATPAGAGLIQALPVCATTPDMTAHWEAILNAISTRAAAYEDFMQPLQAQLEELIRQCQTVLPVGLQGIGGGGTAPRSRGKASPRRKNKKRHAAATKKGKRPTTVTDS